jgi:2-polyprenyl-3-methyl-5-hydroxy-6-metoxy-1,4-benzoquinol methylase
MPDLDPAGAYVLGHSTRELDRLSAQARLIDPITRRFFLAAGIGPGMRVLDVGSGAGDVAFLAAELVGASGEVVGVDRSQAALELARARAAERSLPNVSFVEGDPATIAFESRFDAVVGRFVLQFQDDPARMVRAVAALVRPNGIVLFHELDWDGVRSTPPVPTYDQCCRLIVETLLASKTETRMGSKLLSAFVVAGLPAPSMRLEAVVGGGTNSSDALQLIADLAVSLSTTIEELGLASVADLDPDTLLDRMRNEARANASLVVGHFQFGAWSRVVSAARRRDARR